MSAVGLFAASRGLEVASGINSAYQEQAYAQIQIGVMQRQMDEIESRTQMQLKDISNKAEKVVASQQTAFISAGIELSGSAMSVVSDTLSDAATATYIARREADYDLGSLRMEQQGMKRAASNETMHLKMATSAIAGGAGFAKDMYSYNNMGRNKRGAIGIGDQTPGNSKLDAAGGDTQYSLDYLSS